MIAPPTICGVSLVDELPYAPWGEHGAVVDGEFRWRLGVRPLDLRDWIELGPDADGPDGWIAQKTRLFAEHRDTVFAALDGIERSREVADALVDHLRWRWPDRFGAATLDADLHPLEAASTLVPEDLVLMVERDGRLVFGGGSVCFPNRWDLRVETRSTMAEVHAPVARLNADTRARGRPFPRSPLVPSARSGGSDGGSSTSRTGYTPGDGTGAPRPIDPDVDELFVRVERETLRRFPRNRVRAVHHSHLRRTDCFDRRRFGVGDGAAEAVRRDVGDVRAARISPTSATSSRAHQPPHPKRRSVGEARSRAGGVRR